MDIKDLAPLAILFVVAGITLGIGSQIMQNMQTGGIIPTTTIVNDSVTFTLNDTYYKVSYPFCAGITKFSNYTHTVSLNNVSFYNDQNNGACYVKVLLAHGGGYKMGVWNVTYESWHASDAYKVLQNSTGGVGQVSQWLPTIGLVVAAAIIVGVVLGSFRLGKRE